MNAIARLHDALARKTEDALGKLDALDREAALAFAEAERAADHAVTARLARLEKDLADRSRRFETKLADMFSSALDVATEALERCADDLAGSGRADGKDDRWRPTEAALAAEREAAEREAGETAAEAAADAVLAGGPDAGDDRGQNPVIPEGVTLADTLPDAVRQPDGIPEPSRSVAAQLVAAEVPAFDPADPDDDDQADGEPDGDDEAAAVPALHEKRGEGRRARYVVAEFPEPGQTYFVKDGRRWREVVCQPND